MKSAALMVALIVAVAGCGKAAKPTEETPAAKERRAQACADQIAYVVCEGVPEGQGLTPGPCDPSVERVTSRIWRVSVKGTCYVVDLDRFVTRNGVPFEGVAPVRC